MKINLMKLLLTLALLSLNVSANEDPRVFLSGFIDKESQGNRLQRLDSVVIDAKEYACNSDEGNLVSGEFDMDVNSLYLISDYHFSNKRNDNENAFFDVAFTVVGELYYPCGTKIIDGKSRFFKANKTVMNIKYQLKKSGQKWVILNPPKPFVICSVYGDFLDNEIATLKTSVNRRKSDLLVNALMKAEEEKLFLDDVCFIQTANNKN